MKDLYDLTMTPMMVCIDCRALSRRAIRNTLNVLSILTVLKAERLSPSPYPLRMASETISKTESMTTPPSR